MGTEPEEREKMYSGVERVYGQQGRADAEKMWFVAGVVETYLTETVRLPAPAAKLIAVTAAGALAACEAARPAGAEASGKKRG